MIRTGHLPYTLQPADLFTKALGGADLQFLLFKLSVFNLFSTLKSRGNDIIHISSKVSLVNIIRMSRIT